MNQRTRQIAAAEPDRAVLEAKIAAGRRQAMQRLFTKQAHSIMVTVVV